MKLKALEAYALSLPGAVLDFPFGPQDRVYKVGGKMFALASSGARGAGHVSFKCSDLSFELLTKRKGLIAAPYLQRAKWVYLEDLAAMDDGELKARLAEAHRIIVEKLPKKTQAAILAAAQPKAAPKKKARQ